VKRKRREFILGASFLYFKIDTILPYYHIGPFKRSLLILLIFSVDCLFRVIPELGHVATCPYKNIRPILRFSPTIVKTTDGRLITLYFFSLQQKEILHLLSIKLCKTQLFAFDNSSLSLSQFHPADSHVTNAIVR
jgi:hypothetical protein